MNRTIRAGITGALLAGGIAALATVSSVGPVAQEEIEPASAGFAPYIGQLDQGRIELVTEPGRKLSIAYFDEADAETAVTSITYDPKRNEKCQIDPAKTTVDGTTLLDISLKYYTDDSTAGATGTVSDHDDPRIGLVDNGLGSYEQDNCNQSNGRLEPGEAFEIRLGDHFTADTFVNWVELDIEGKFGASFEAITDAQGQTDWFRSLGNSSDNAADAGATDNNIVAVGAADTADDNFRTIVIAPVSTDGRGELALEGGGDFDAAVSADHRSVFYLSEQVEYEYTLVCEAETDLYTPNGDGTVKGVIETPDEPDWLPVVGSAEPTQARLFRYYGYEHTDGHYGEGEYPTPKESCDPIGANLSADEPGVLLEPSDDSAFLRVELTWVVPADAINGTSDPRLDRTVDLDGPGTLFGPEPAQYCERFGPSGATSAPASTFDASDPGVADHVLVDPDGGPSEFVPWCVISDVRELTEIDGVDVIVQTQVWDGIGDPMWN